MAAEGRNEDARDWLTSKQHSLGEMTSAVSRRLVEKLFRLGAINIRACKIDSYENGTENTGHLVLELPAETQRRVALLKEIERLARKQGYAGDADDGQRYAYLKLD